MKITFVCTGNTCRSPMAEGIFRKMLEEEKIENIECSSAGISAMTGDPVSENAVEAVKEYGVDISAHRASSLNSYRLMDTDLFVCLSQSHRFALASAIGSERVIVLGKGISDPYGSDVETYKECAGEIYEALKELLEKVKKEVNIIPMGCCHVREIAEIEKQCFSSPWSEKSIGEELENENAHFIVAVFNEKVVGYMGVHSVCGECYVDNIAVIEEYRRQGIASKLLDRAVRDSIIRNDEFISLEVRKSNIPAICLYEKYGFSIEGERKNFYTNPQEDAHIMTCRFK